jgi:hypothetical protein
MPETDNSLESEPCSFTRAEFLAERRCLIDSEYQQSLAFDRTTIILASGALGLSLTFIKDGIGQTPNSTYAIYIGWSLLVLAVLSTLSSFQLSVQAYQRQRKIFEVEYSHPERKINRRNHWSTLVNLTNWLSLFAIAIGMAFITFFVATNAWSPR